MGHPPGMPWDAGMGRGFPPGFREGFPGAMGRQGSESPGDDDSEFGSSDEDRKRDRDSHRRRDRDRDRSREHRERWCMLKKSINIYVKRGKESPVGFHRERIDQN